ncbi:MAG: hypothetical protein QXR87_05995 [Candidatus Hadarchaeales archaeon]
MRTGAEVVSEVLSSLLKGGARMLQAGTKILEPAVEVEIIEKSQK